MNFVIFKEREVKQMFAIVAIFALLLSSIGLGTTHFAQAAPSGDGNIQICHATGSGFVKNSPSKTADAGGHAGDSHQDARDIIPPFDIDGGGFFPGQNWDAEGEAIWNSGECDGTLDPEPATITVTKVVVNDDDGTLGVGDFPLFVGATPVTSGVSKEFDAGVYTVSETSDSGYTASDWGGDCDTDGSITMEAGLIYSCTITNDDEPPVVIPGCMDETALNYDETATEDDQSCEYPTVTICKVDGSEEPLAGWNVFITDGQTDYGGETGALDSDFPGCVLVEDVPLGDYTLDETLKEGWSNVEGKGDAVVVDEETETFYLMNRLIPADKGQIIVEKFVTEGSSTSTNFTFDLSWSETDFVLSHGQSDGAELDADLYSVSETVPTGWTLESAECLYEDQSTSTPASIDLAEGETVTCTFTNDEDEIVVPTGTLQIIKVIEGDPTANPDDFSFQINGGDPIAFNNSGFNEIEKSVDGTYSVTEVEDEGYTTTYANNENSGLDCTELSVEEGETTTCWIINTLIVEETYLVDGYKWNDIDGNGEWGEEPTLSGWTIEITDGETTLATTTDSNGYYWFEVLGGTWTVSEVQQGGWTQTAPEGGTCQFDFGGQTQIDPPNHDLASAIFNFFIPTAHATVIESDGRCDFGNQENEEPEVLACSISASQNPVSSGQAFDLIWNTDFADFVEIDQGIGSGLALDGSVSTSITSDTTFTLTAWDEEEGSVQCNVAVTVESGGGGGGSRSVSCKAFELDGDTLSWETRNGRDMTITSNGVEIFSTTDDDVIDEGEFVVGQSDSAPFELTVIRSNRSDTCTIEASGGGTPTPQVLGEQVSAVPLGAANTGAGGAAGGAATGTAFALFAMLASIATLRSTRVDVK